MSKIISPIAIDMGAKNTGVYLNHFEQGKDPTTSGNKQGKTIVIDSASITWSQADRTGKRHQIRTSKRGKLSKRLLKLILDEYDIKPNQVQNEYLSGLLNRRGYNRIEITEEQKGILQSKLVSDFFSPIVFNNPNNNNILDELLKELTIKNDKDKTKWENVLKNKIFSMSGNKNSEFKKHVEDKYKKDKDEVAELSKAFTAIKKTIEKQIDNYVTGHLHRKDYLENIQKDIENSGIENSGLLQPLLSSLSAEKITYLIGNISNLQLRVLRKYFNDKSMQAGDKWLPEKLHQMFFKWVGNWHAKQPNEKDNRIEILALKDNKNILDIFTSLDPKKTIPPYEDQNNRRPPKDLTLKLKPSSLDKNLENWEAVTQLLAENYIIDIQEGLKDNVSPQKYKGRSQDTEERQIREERQILADTLHRILDRTIILDPYKLRWLAQNSDTPEAKTAKSLLNQHSNNQADIIVDFAKKYYSEIEKAKQGLWADNENTLFFRCDTNPPHKNKIQHNLISHILGEKLNKEKLNEFIDNCWDSDIKVGRSTIVNIAKKAEEERKLYGNRFKHLLDRQLYLKQENRALDNDKEHGVDGKSILKVYDNCLQATGKVAEYFKHNKNQKKIYANVFSFCQLYNILETQIKGFSKTDRWNTIENSWRSSKDNFDEKGDPIANASRLTADSIRPFDGLLDRIISRQAIEIVRAKIAQIESLNINTKEQLFVPIFMEQNRFKFEQDMAEIKSNTKKKDNAKKGLEKQAIQWQNKDNRIKKNTICPYTGEQIGKGEIDHIIPQSQSKKHNDVVFNSEANLIYCSGTGNHQKGDKRWTFERLNADYLSQIFANETDVKQTIINFVDGLDENDPISFHNLEEKEQNYLRHALFIHELDSKTFPILNTRYKTFVNGTQGYLGKQIRELLQKEYPNIEVKTYQIPAKEVSQLRTVLGEYDKAFKKQEKQGAFSHVVDAALVLAIALQNPKIAEELTTTNVAELSEKGEWLKNLLPANIDVQHIKRKPKYRKNLESTQIFKDGLYGERFMPILLDDKKLYYGFALDNCHKIKPNKRQGFETIEVYFDLLKPFLYTGKKNAKKPVSGDLSDNWQYQYLSIDKTKALTHLQKCAKEVCNEIEIKQAQQLENLRYSVEKKKIKDVLLIGQGNKTFISALKFAKKFTVSGLTLPAKLQWEALINYPIEYYDGNKPKLKDCFGKPEQVEIDNKDMLGFWQKLAEESNLTVDYLQEHLFKRNDKKELAKKSGIIPKSVFDKKIKEEEKLKVLENSTLLKKSFGIEFKTTTDLIPQESWSNLFQEFFHTDKIANNNQHKQVRKEYSLPIVSAPDGGFRIKRKNPLTGEVVYQVSAIKGFATKGYDKTLKNPVLIDGLNDSPNIASLDGKQVEVDDIYYFDEWKEIQIPEELKEKISFLSYAIGTKGRFNIRVSMSFDRFKELDNSINDFSNISSEIKEPKKNDSWKFKKAIFQGNFIIDNPKLKDIKNSSLYKDLITKDKKGKEKIVGKKEYKKITKNDNGLSSLEIYGEFLKITLLGKPRSNLFVEFVSENKITFSYIVGSTNSEMKTAYQNGTPIK